MLDGGITERDVIFGDLAEASAGIDVTPEPNLIADLVEWTADVHDVERAVELCPDAEVVIDGDLRICSLACGSPERALEIHRYPDASAEDLCLLPEEPRGTSRVYVRRYDFGCD